MTLYRYRTMILAPAVALVAGVATAQSHTANFDGNAEGSLTTVYVEDGITFSDLDQYLGGNPPFVAEDASSTLAGFTGFTPPMTLGFGGYSPGGGAAFSRCGTFKITPPALFSQASVHFYVAGGSSAGNIVTLEARLGGSVVASDQFTVPGSFGPHHFELKIAGASYDELRVVGSGTAHSGSFFGLVDTVVIGAGVVGTGYCFGDPGSGTPCPCGNDNDGSVPGSGCANGIFPSGAQLTGSGAASVGGDTLVLSSTGLEPNNSGLYFQANNDLSPGVIWGDGLRCAGGGLIRLGVRFSDGSGRSDTSGFAYTLSARSASFGHPITAGETLYYQIWYRNPTASPCSTEFNASNGYAVTWQP